MFTNTDLLTHGFILLFVVIWLIAPVKRLSYVLIASIFTTLASVITITYALSAFYSPKWPLVFWAAAFIAVSALKTWRCYRYEPTFNFSVNEQRLYHRFFYDLSPANYAQLIEFAVWREINAGETLLTRGEIVARLSLIFSGLAKVNMGNGKFVDITEGQFIGEMSYISGNLASTTVMIAEKTLLVEWPQTQLKALVSQNSLIGNCIQAHFNRDLIKKLA